MRLAERANGCAEDGGGAFVVGRCYGYPQMGWKKKKRQDKNPGLVVRFSFYFSKQPNGNHQIGIFVLCGKFLQLVFIHHSCPLMGA